MKTQNYATHEVENPALSGFLIGEVLDDPVLINEIHRNNETIRIMGTRLKVEKLWQSGEGEPVLQGEDHLPIHYTEGRNGSDLIVKGDQVFVRGEIRDAKIPLSECSAEEQIAYEGKPNRTIIYLKAKVIRRPTPRENDKANGFIKNNAFTQTGVVCNVIQQKHPNSKYPKVDVVVRFGNKHSDGRDYRIPVVGKKGIALKMTDVQVGDIIQVTGRMESRTFPKRFTDKNGEKRRAMLSAIELRAYKFKLIEKAAVEETAIETE